VAFFHVAAKSDLTLGGFRRNTKCLLHPPRVFLRDGEHLRIH